MLSIRLAKVRVRVTAWFTTTDHRSRERSGNMVDDSERTLVGCRVRARVRGYSSCPGAS